MSAVCLRRLSGEPCVPGLNALFPGGRPFPGVQSITHRNALTVSSSVPPFSERLCFFTSLSERLHMLLPPPPPNPFGRLTLSYLGDPIPFSLRHKEVKRSYFSWEETTAPSSPRGNRLLSQPVAAPLVQQACHFCRRQVLRSSPRCREEKVRCTEPLPAQGPGQEIGVAGARDDGRRYLLA